jgi:hypothetical protein
MTLEGTVPAAGGQASGDPSPAAPPERRDDTPPAGTPPASPEAAGQEEEAAIALLGREAYDSVRSDPAKLSKALHKSYTQKMQQMSAHRDFLRQWQEDPEAVIEHYAKEYGYNVSKPDPAQEIADEVTNLFAGLFGDEHAKQMVPGIEKLVNRVLDQRIKPLEDGVNETQRDTALQQVTATLERFTKEYPDWKQYEADMEELGKKLMPNGLEDYEYMEILYNKVKGKTAAADAADAAIKRRDNSIRNGAPPTAGVPPKKVSAIQLNAKGQLDWDFIQQCARDGILLDPKDVREAKRQWRAANTPPRRAS